MKKLLRFWKQHDEFLQTKRLQEARAINRAVACARAGSLSLPGDRFTGIRIDTHIEAEPAPRREILPG